MVVSSRGVELLVLLFACACAGPRTPAATQGRLDLSGFDLRGGRPVALDGEWEFFSGEFMAPEEYLYWSELGARNTENVRPRVINLPGDRDLPPIPGARPGTGHGTFVLRLEGLPVDAELALRVGPVGGAYRLYLVPAPLLETVRERHEPGRSPFRPFLRSGYADEIYSVPRVAPALGSFTVTDPVLILILHVANHDAPRGSLQEPILLGADSELRGAEDRWRAAHFAFFGFFAALGLFHLGRLMRGPARASGFFIALMFLGTFWLFFASHRAEELFPAFDRGLFYFFRRCEFLCRALFIAVWLSYPFAQGRVALPGRPALALLWSATLAFAAVALFASLRTALDVQACFDLVAAGVLAYSVLGILIALRSGDPRGLPYLVCVGLVLTGLLYDFARPGTPAGRMPAGLGALALVAVLASNLFGGRALPALSRLRRLARELRVIISRKNNKI